MNVRFTLAVGVVFNLFFGFSQPNAQVPIKVGSTVEFGGTVVALNEQGRSRLQQEVNRLYADRAALNTQLEQLRQLDPFIQETLQKASLPVDFRFLALPFDSKHGYWYIPAQLADRFGLQTNKQLDERYHPLLATNAAAVSLGRSYTRTANSLRIAIDYLQAADGEQNERLSGDGPFLLLDSDSPPIVWKLLARRLVFNYEDPAFRPNRTFLIWTREGGGRTLTDVAFQYNLTTDRLQPYASWLRGSVLPSDPIHQVLIRMTPDEYAKAIPQRFGVFTDPADPSNPDTGFPVLRRLAPVKSALNTLITLYEINSLPGIQAQPGDNIITLAFYGNISVRQFMEYNDMTDRDVVRPGEVYYLAPKRKRAAVPFHGIDRGQTIRDVANQYGVQLKFLLRYNDIEANQRVQEGRVIWLQRKRPKDQPIEYRQLPPRPQPPVFIPDSTQAADSTQTDSTGVTVPVDTLDTDSVLVKPVSASVVSVSSTAPELPAPRVRVHSVQPGQTYFSIARQYGIPLSQLYQLNNVSERIPLRVGQKLIVDVAGSTTKPASPSANPPVSKPIRSPAAAKPSQTRNQGMKTIFQIERVPATEAPAKPSAPTNSTTTSPTVRYHVVQPGQTVYRVALINRITVEQVMRWNNLRNYNIEVGQRLIIQK